MSMLLLQALNLKTLNIKKHMKNFSKKKEEFITNIKI